jgi:hypothetical protein
MNFNEVQHDIQEWLKLGLQKLRKEVGNLNFNDRTIDYSSQWRDHV